MASAPTERVVRVRLAPNPLSPLRILTLAAPFVGGVVALAILGNVLERLDLLRSKGAQTVFSVGGLAAVAGLVFWTTMIRARRTTQLSLDAGPDGVRLLEPSGKTISASPTSGVSITRSSWRYTTRATSFDCPSITLSWDGQRPLSVGAIDVEGRWSDQPRGPAPRYLLAQRDWQALLEALGVK